MLRLTHSDVESAFRGFDSSRPGAPRAMFGTPRGRSSSLFPSVATTATVVGAAMVGAGAAWVAINHGDRLMRMARKGWRQLGDLINGPLDLRNVTKQHGASVPFHPMTKELNTGVGITSPLNYRATEDQGENITESSEESFPASDPPSFTPGSGVGRCVTSNCD